MISIIGSHRGASDRSGTLAAFSRTLRLVLQSFVLGLGAYLVINQKATAGVIIASAILTSRALAPVELAIANWKGFVAARQGRRRLSELLAGPAARQGAVAAAEARDCSFRGGCERQPTRQLKGLFCRTSPSR